MKEYAENKDRIMNEISKLSEEKKEDFIEYLLQYTLKKQKKLHFNLLIRSYLFYI